MSMEVLFNESEMDYTIRISKKINTNQSILMWTLRRK